MLILASAQAASKAYATDIRPPVRAGSFYPADRHELEQMIDHLTRQAQKTAVKIPAAKSLKALILPHAGYLYSGLTAAHASLVLREKQFSKVILLGPDHFVGLANGALCDATAYQTPLGQIDLHADVQKLRRQPHLFQPNLASDRQEHSLEVVLPFLQRYLKGFEIIPIVVGPTHIRRFADELDPLLDHNTLLVVSSDLSHYLPYGEASRRDQETIAMILRLEAHKLSQTDNRACGLVPLMILIDLAQRHSWQPLLLHYTNSGDTAGGRSQVVGYAAIAFYGDPPMPNNTQSIQHFSPEQGQSLVKLARHTIMEKLGRKVDESEALALAAALRHSCFQSCCGTFVTLKLHGQLRGCIGNLTATESVVKGVRQNAINAAFHDPRFAPLTLSELEQVAIEVSILTEPQLLEYRDGTDLLGKLQPHVDGVILRKGYTSATFLPQVWEQLPQAEEFLRHLCQKAGMSPDAWCDPEIEVATYQVQYFEEHK
ncbi:MAG: AmmeMemoRadiSam system protein B [Desulfobacterales bacterium]|nr:MAG: AmmeMemoRadiSam system protein B [Desulfobacterales bacterium]